jgi:acrylyl-CoA reductase (NADPH)/3-hydroxypropionyl-CoA dehydratase/3-hydroxypropionyl-CoA synthetase
MTDAQREIVQSLGYRDSVRGVVSIEEIRRKEGADFDWPRALPTLPDGEARHRLPLQVDPSGNSKSAP